MATYVALLNWTPDGIHQVKDTVDRYKHAQQAFERLGANLHTVYWTQGQYDLVAIFDAPDDQTASAAILAVTSRGSLRSVSMRAYNEQEMTEILQKLG